MHSEYPSSEQSLLPPKLYLARWGQKTNQGSLPLVVVLAHLKGETCMPPAFISAAMPSGLHFKAPVSKLCSLLPFPVLDLQEQIKAALCWGLCWPSALGPQEGSELAFS